MKKAKYKIGQMIKTKDGSLYEITGILLGREMISYDVAIEVDTPSFIDEREIAAAYNVTIQRTRKRAKVKAKVQEMLVEHGSGE